MALTFPRDMTTGRPWWPAKIWLNRRQEMSRTAGGAPAVADIGPALWRADFKTAPVPRSEADAILADFESLGGALRSFYAHPPDRSRPVAYPDGELSGQSVAAISADRSEMRIDSLPAQMRLTPGDFVSVTTAAGGRELTRVVTTGQAGSGGLSSFFDIHPPLRPSVQVGDPVTLINPLVEMVLEPGSLTREVVNEPFHAIAFQAWQVVR